MKTRMKAFNKNKGLIINNVQFNPVPGLNSVFVSRCGKVYSSYSQDYKYTWKTNTGYTLFACYRNGKSSSMILSRAILMAWRHFPNKMSYSQFLTVENQWECNHIDENKSNNHIDNLEWTTCAENVVYGTRCERQAESLKGNQNAKGRKNTPESFDRYVYICDEIEFERILELAAYLGVSKSALTEAFRKGKTTCGGKKISRRVLPKAVKKEPTRHYQKREKKTLVREYRLYDVNNVLVYKTDKIDDLCETMNIRHRSYVYKYNKTGEYFSPYFGSNIKYRVEVEKNWV